MIGKIKGKLIEVDGNTGLIETSGGVSYEIYLSPQVISSHEPPIELNLYTHLQVREDALVLFGFQTKKEHKFFKLLLTVSGVGPKTAFNVVSFVSLDSLVSGVKNNDVEVFNKVPGLGRKTAMKIILELSTKLKTEFDMKNMILSDEDKIVIDALISLGYKINEAKKIISKLPKNLSIEEKIKKALSTK